MGTSWSGANGGQGSGQGQEQGAGTGQETVDVLTEMERKATMVLHTELGRAREATMANKPTPRSARVEHNFDADADVDVGADADADADGDADGDAAVDLTPLAYPVDEEGFAVAYQDPAEIKAVFDEYGVVVVGGCLDEDECVRSMDAVWSFLERHAPPIEPRLERNKPETWANVNWPGLAKMGILGDTICLEPQFMDNRVNPRVVDAFAAVLGTHEMWVNVGRASVMRPTKNVPIPVSELDAEDDAEALAGERVTDALGRECVLMDMDMWRTIAGWLHLDFDPKTGEGTSFSWHNAQPGANVYDDDDPNVKVQGVLALKDCSVVDGGFHCVPGMARVIREWAAANADAIRGPNLGDTTVQIPQDDPMRSHIQRIGLRAGSLVIWDSATPHGSYPNESSEFRAIQYVKATRRDQAYWRPLFSDQFLPPGWSPPSELAAALLGCDDAPTF